MFLLPAHQLHRGAFLLGILCLMLFPTLDSVAVYCKVILPFSPTDCFKIRGLTEEACSVDRPTDHCSIQGPNVTFRADAEFDCILNDKEHRFKCDTHFTIGPHHPPTNTTVFTSATVSALMGSNVTLTCSSEANPPVLNYTWYKVNGTEMRAVGSGQNLTINVTECSEQYYCRALNKYGKDNSTIQLNGICSGSDSSHGSRSMNKPPRHRILVAVVFVALVVVVAVLTAFFVKGWRGRDDRDLENGVVEIEMGTVEESRALQQTPDAHIPATQRSASPVS
ncbi:hypothetical protein GJAV_G00171900 [Gymnothorax javanicus]|nr:hypothetical protein GJAV_G00171900 [Gymnothorax javanicus]